jgi:hypothetical protein
LTLLRERNLVPSTLDIVQVVQASDRVSLDACEMAYRNTELSPALSLAATLVLDAARSLEEGVRFVEWDKLDWKLPLSVLSLPCLQQEVFRMAFCSAMTQKSHIVYLFSKTILQRCMTRKFGGVCVRTFKESPQTCEVVKLIVLACLLGNYEHSKADTRPEPRVRDKLYDLLLDNQHRPEHHEWFITLVTTCPYLVEFAIRDFVSFHIRDDPAFARHVACLFDLDNFYLVVSKTTEMIRTRVALHFTLGTPTDQMCTDLTSALQPFHTALLALSYRLPKTRADLLTALTSMRESLPISRKQDEPTATSSEKNEEEDFDKIQEQLGVINIKGGEQTLLARDEDEVPVKAEPSVLKVAREVLGDDRFDRLDEWVRTIAPTRRDAVPCLVSLFPLIGVKVASANKILHLIEEFRIGSMNVHALRQLKLVREEDPLAYDVLQIMVDLIKQHTRVVLVGRLPAHVIEGQFKAVQNQFKQLVDSQYAVMDAFDFVWCSVCDALYSMVREFKSSFKKTYRHGLRDAIVDYDTDTCWCWRGKENHIGKCREVPLVRISLFGVMLRHGGRTVALCPGCAGQMILETELCVFTEYGPVCSMCTSRIGTPEVIEKARLLNMEKAPRGCTLCATELRNPSSSVYYAPGVYLCMRHHCRQMVRAVRALEGVPTIEDIKKALVDTHKLIREEKVNRSKGIWKRQLAQLKLSRNSKR